MAIAIKMTKVTGPKPTVVIEGIFVQRLIGVALEHHWTLQPNLAVFAGQRDDALKGDNANLASGYRFSIGVHQLRFGVVRSALSNHRTFRHAIAVTNRNAHLGHYLDVHLGRLRCTSAREESQRRDDLLGRLRTLLCKIHLVERRTAASHRGALARKQLNRHVKCK